MEDINKKDREKKEELYYVYMASKSLFMEAEEELAAVSHEIRAFFDTADFICINVRKQMAESLKRISTRKLKKVWPEYWDIKKRIFDLSDDIAVIRKERKGRITYVHRYEKEMEELWKIYRDFELNILKKLREKR